MTAIIKLCVYFIFKRLLLKWFDDLTVGVVYVVFFFFSSRRRHTRLQGDWSSDVCSSDLVVPDTPAELTTETMQALALEIGFSETTFVTAVRPDGYDVRIFTPEEELPFEIGRASCRERV